MATGSAAHALDGWLPFKESGYLAARFVSDRVPDGIHAEITVSEAEQPHTRIPIGNLNKYPIGTMAITGKWWPLMGEFVQNVGIEWRNRDAIHVSDASGKTFTIIRGQIAKYPELERRFKAARFSFTRMTIRVVGRTASGALRDLTFTVDANEVIVPPEGQAPYMAAPGSPPHWKDALALREGALPLDDSDTNMRRLWKELESIALQRPHLPSIHIEGVRLPTNELIAIAKDFARYEQDAEALGEDYALLERPIPGHDALGAFTGDGPLAEPFEDRLEPGERIKENGKVGIRYKGQVVFDGTGTHHFAWEAPGSRHFIFSRTDRADDGSTFDAYNARGQRVLIPGVNGADIRGCVPSDDGKTCDLYLCPPGTAPVHSGMYRDLLSGNYSTEEALNRAMRSNAPRAGAATKAGTLELVAPKRPVDFYSCTIVVIGADLRRVSSRKGGYAIAK